MLFPVGAGLATTSEDDKSAAGKSKARSRKPAADSGSSAKLRAARPQDSRQAGPEHNRRDAGATLSDAIKTRLFDLRKRGFNRLFQNGEVFEFSTPESLLDINFSEPVFALVDRLAVSADQRSRIVDAVEIGYREVGRSHF